jgi:hypothetical protein
MRLDKGPHVETQCAINNVPSRSSMVSADQNGDAPDNILTFKWLDENRHPSLQEA